MARPVTGGTPNSVRQARTKDRLLQAGGRKVCAALPAESVAHLEALRRAGHQTDKDAIIAALAIAAKSIP